MQTNGRCEVANGRGDTYGPVSYLAYVPGFLAYRELPVLEALWADLARKPDVLLVDGRVEIRDGGFQNYRYESLVADVDYTGDRVDVDATLTQTPAERITVKGSAPMSLFQASEGEGHIPAAAGDEVDLRIRSTALGLGVVQGFTDLLANVTGTLEADVRVTGSGQDPHLEGYIDIKGGGFGIPLGGVGLSSLIGAVAAVTDNQQQWRHVRRRQEVPKQGRTVGISPLHVVDEQHHGTHVRESSKHFAQGVERPSS